MPFVRFSRDKRGYEYIYLVHAPSGRGAASRPRVLYWYRTPPGVRVGREPFDPTVREALQAQYPDLTFDWKGILEAQAPPPPEFEPWRERRRAERSAKQARAATRDEDPAAVVEPSVEVAGFGNAESAGEAVEAPTLPATTDRAGEAVSPGADIERPEPKGRRRRRGGRRRPGAGTAVAQIASDTPGPPATAVAAVKPGDPADSMDPMENDEQPALASEKPGLARQTTPHSGGADDHLPDETTTPSRSS